jgi:glycosyltransferase involved in cell wall biosynthesis
MDTKANTPLLTAIIPVKELESHYPRFRDWVCKVNPSDLLILVIDDGQKKQTNSILMSLQRELPLGVLKVLKGENKGPGSARNIGLSQVKSPWVCFWDVDDLPQVDTILAELKAIETDGTEILIGAFETVDSLGKLKIQAKTFSANQKQNLSLIAIDPGLWRFCFRSRAIKDIKFPEIYMGEDQVFVARCDIESKNIFYSNEIFYHYVKGSNEQLTNSKSAIRDLALAIEYISIILISRPTSQTTKIQTLRLILSGLLRGNVSSKLNSLVWLAKEIIVNRKFSLKDLRIFIQLLMGKR